MGVQAQLRTQGPSRVSASARLYIAEAREAVAQSPAAARQTSRSNMLHLQAIFSEQPATGFFSEYGILPQSKVGKVQTLLVPLASVQALIAHEDLVYLDGGTPPKPTLDRARIESFVQGVHVGNGLEQVYQGEGVVLGVIDIGFEYSHPAFWDVEGDSNRVKRIWNQRLNPDAFPNFGPPAGHDYGVEFRNYDSLFRTLSIPDSAAAEEQEALLADSTGHFHGTHVASTAGGSGSANRQFTGMAPKTDLVFVTFGTAGGSELVDAMSYITSYAESVGKPCVINLSIGATVGPHDGTSLEDRAMDSLSGPGKVIVGAAGNERRREVHVPIEMPAGATDTVQSFVRFRSKGFFIDAWFNHDTATRGRFVFRDTTGAITASRWMAPTTEEQIDTLFLPSDDTLRVRITGESQNPFNGKDNLLFQVGFMDETNNVGDDNVFDYYFQLAGKGLKGDAWTNHKFSNKNRSGFTPGDASSSIQEVGGTGKSTLTVGAYALRSETISENGENTSTDVSPGQLMPFSSAGPTADGRIKPFITAPGGHVNAPYSYFYENFRGNLGGSRSASLQNPHAAGMNTFYGYASGTSMSSPVVAGTVALMLQANPKLEVEEIREILRITAREDDKTGNIGSEGSNLWGFGKLHSREAVKEAEARVVGLASPKAAPAQFRVFPNPTAGRLQVRRKETETTNSKVHFVLRDALGRTVQQRSQAPASVHRLDFSGLGSGLYFLQISNENGNEQHKIRID